MRRANRWSFFLHLRHGGDTSARSRAAAAKTDGTSLEHTHNGENGQAKCNTEAQEQECGTSLVFTALAGAAPNLLCVVCGAVGNSTPVGVGAGSSEQENSGKEVTHGENEAADGEHNKLEDNTKESRDYNCENCGKNREISTSVTVSAVVVVEAAGTTKANSSEDDEDGTQGEVGNFQSRHYLPDLKISLTCLLYSRLLPHVLICKQSCLPMHTLHIADSCGFVEPSVINSNLVGEFQIKTGLFRGCINTVSGLVLVTFEVGGIVILLTT